MYRKMKTGKPTTSLRASHIPYAGKLILPLVLMMMICWPLKSNEPMGTDSVQSKMECLYDGTQKVYLQVNKNIYISGEEVLFKAFLVNASDSRPDTVCKILYMVLVNSCNQKISAIRLNLHQGTCQGYFVLPDTLTTGYYRISAFTNSMRNFSHDLYFSSRIFVGNQGDDKMDNLITDEPQSQEDLNFSVFPESGKLLEGISNRVVFRFSGPIWKPGQSVEIISDLKGTIATVPLDGSGMGEMMLTPQAGEKYVARFQNREFPFNLSGTSGFNLKVLLKENRGIDVKIQTNIKENISNPLHLIRYSEGSVTIDIPVFFTGDSVLVSLTEGKAGKGIVHLCLLNSSMDLLCERTFYRPDALQDIILPLKSGTYGTRQKVQIAVHVPSAALRSGRIHLSANVSQIPDSGSLVQNGNLNNTFLFSEFGKNNISELHWDSITNQTVDRFLISHKSIRYSWENIIQHAPVCNNMPETTGYIISGKVVTKSNEPVPRVCVYLSAPDSLVNLKYCYTDDHGRFRFRMNKFYDNRNLIFQITSTDIPEGTRIDLEDKFNDEPAKTAVVAGMPASLRSYLLQSRTLALVNKVYKPMFIHPLSVPETGSSQVYSSFYGLPDLKVFTSDYTELDNFNEIAKNILPGVNYSGNTHKLRVMDIPSEGMQKEEAMLFLNNIPFPDPVFVSKLDSRLIRKIELKKNHLLFGELDIYGIVAITTNQKDVYALDPGHTSLVFPNKVNDLPIMVSGPDYDGKRIEMETLPDFRQTLYWNPEIEIINGMANLEFYTSDVKGLFSIELAGITSDGHHLSGQARIKVQ
jgi:hypothetical protein